MPFLRQVKEFMEPSISISAVNASESHERGVKLTTNKHASRSTNHIHGKHNLVKRASDARKFRVACARSKDQHVDLLTKPLDMKSYSHMEVKLLLL